MLAPRVSTVDFDAWDDATGIVLNPDRATPGWDISFASPCSSTPEDATFEYDFVTSRVGEKVIMCCPLLNYHSYQESLDNARN